MPHSYGCGITNKGEKMNGIFYFSGTGNSLWLAKQVKIRLGGEIRYIPKWNGDISVYDKLIIVCPV